MLRPDRKQALLFLLHFTMLFVAFLMPWPWLADAYATGFDVTANGLLLPINSLSEVKLRFEPPESIAIHGSWKAKLHVEDTRTGQVARTNLDVRGFSYRPLATFMSLAIAAPLHGRRRIAVVLGAGGLLMVALGMFFSALPILAKFSAGGALGVGPGLAARTAYEAIATPVMVYAIPLIVFWALVASQRR